MPIFDENRFGHHLFGVEEATMDFIDENWTNHALNLSDDGRNEAEDEESGYGYNYGFDYGEI